MERVVRAFPISSKEDLLKLAEGIDDFSPEQKRKFFDNFNDVTEDWYFQEIEGRPYVIAVAEGKRIEEGFDRYSQLNDDFSTWFKSQAKTLTGYDLDATPKGPESQHVYQFRA